MGIRRRLMSSLGDADLVAKEVRDVYFPLVNFKVHHAWHSVMAQHGPHTPKHLGTIFTVLLA